MRKRVGAELTSAANDDSTPDDSRLSAKVIGRERRHWVSGNRPNLGKRRIRSRGSMNWFEERGILSLRFELR